jgi:hypothetical protein
MVKKKVFVSFDFDNDKHLKASFIGEAKLQQSPLSIVDSSLQETQPNSTWLSMAQSSIARCDVFMVLLGAKTHKASGVLKEVNIAKGLKKRRFQLKPQGKDYVSVPGAGEVVIWKRKNLKNRLS